MRHRRFPLAAVWIAGVLFVAAAAWLVFGVPALVKYPTDIDASPRYEGTFNLYVNPATAAPLATPLVEPLIVDRHIQAIPEESSSSQVLVRETINQQAGNILNTTQGNAYVMDRSTNLNVTDPRAFAFEPANVVDRSGAYRLNLPFGTSADSNLEIYKNEIGDTYRIVPDTQNPSSDVEGLNLLNFTGSMADAPLTPAYIAELNKTTPLPPSLTLDQLKPHLLAAGIDVDTVLAALAPRLTPADAATLASFAGNPIPLDYVLSFEGTAAVEPVTGAEVVVGSNETVGVRPQASALPAIENVLLNYPDVPEAVTAVEGLNRLSAGPAIRLFSYEFQQTPASVADVAEVVTSQRRQVQLATTWLPVALVVLGLLSLAVGGVVWLRRRQPTGPIDLTGEPEKAAEPRVATKVDSQELTSPRNEPR